MDKFSVCIIGCGDIGFLFDHGKKIKGALTHFKAFNESKGFHIAAVAEKDTSIRELIYNKYKIPVYNDFITMCKDHNPDVVVVATNDESHFKILKDLIKFNPKLVFCEKPLALDSEDVMTIANIYNEKNIYLQVNYTRRFLDEFYDINKTIKGKEIGEIESITFYYSRGLIHNASHYIDLVNWYIGETENILIKVSVKKGIGKNDDTISFDLTYKKGPEIRFIGLSPSKLSFAEIDIIGSSGRIKINYRNEIERYKVIENKMYKGYSVYELYNSRPVQFSKALPNAVENIFNVLSKKEKLKSPASNSIKIFELIDRIKEKELCQN